MCGVLSDPVLCCIVKSFNFVGTKYLGLDDDGHVHGHLYSWISNYRQYKVNKYFVGILNLWISLPMKLNVQRIQMRSVV